MKWLKENWYPVMFTLIIIVWVAVVWFIWHDWRCLLFYCVIVK